MLKIGNISNLLSAQYYYSSTANLHYVIPYLCKYYAFVIVYALTVMH
jgi:hypothetical protein